MITIKHKTTGDVLLEIDAPDLSGANLRCANLCGANLCGANLYGADLHSAKGVYSFGPIGEEKRIGYAVKHDNKVMVKLGCFWGPEDEAVRAVSAKYGQDSVYVRQVTLACDILKKRGGKMHHNKEYILIEYSEASQILVESGAKTADAFLKAIDDSVCEIASITRVLLSEKSADDVTEDYADMLADYFMEIGGHNASYREISWIYNNASLEKTCEMQRRKLID